MLRKILQRHLILKAFSVKSTDIHKIEKKSSISVFGYDNKVKYLICVLKNCYEDKHVDLSLIGEGREKVLCFCQRF